MPIDERRNTEVAEVQFPNLLDAIELCEKVLKKLRGLRNKRLASDLDVEAARSARDNLLTILDKGNWIKSSR
jgi:hypothetical protein